MGCSIQAVVITQRSHAALSAWFNRYDILLKHSDVSLQRSAAEHMLITTLFHMLLVTRRAAFCCNDARILCVSSAKGGQHRRACPQDCWKEAKTLACMYLLGRGAGGSIGRGRVFVRLEARKAARFPIEGWMFEKLQAALQRQGVETCSSLHQWK